MNSWATYGTVRRTGRNSRRLRHRPSWPRCSDRFYTGTHLHRTALAHLQFPQQHT